MSDLLNRAPAAGFDQPFEMLENDVVFPAARSAMDAAAVGAMGAEMAARRQAATGSTAPESR